MIIFTVFQDYLKLGPLELKLLNISGKKMPIYGPRELTMEEIEANKFTAEEFGGGRKMKLKAS